jgi:ubiquinone/menaquinone biosynthesis C-methylase UbiE
MAAVPKHTIAAYWNTRCRTYRNGTGGFCREERAVWWNELSRVVPDDGRMQVLDTGTGLGFLALLFAEKGHVVTGLDIAAGMLKGARGNAGAMELTVGFVLGDTEHLPFRDHTFDCVVSKYLLWTLPSPERVLEEWKRIVKPGGRIIAVDGLWFSPSASDTVRKAASEVIRRALEGTASTGFSRYYEDLKGDLPLYAQRDTKRVRQLFDDAGLADVELSALKDVQRFMQMTAPRSLTVRYPDPPFLITGITPEK